MMKKKNFIRTAAAAALVSGFAISVYAGDYSGSRTKTVNTSAGSADVTCKVTFHTNSLTRWSYLTSASTSQLSANASLTPTRADESYFYGTAKVNVVSYTYQSGTGSTVFKFLYYKGNVASLD